jgi:hypothetical protein
MGRSGCSIVAPSHGSMLALTAQSASGRTPAAATRFPVVEGTCRSAPTAAVAMSSDFLKLRLRAPGAGIFAVTRPQCLQDDPRQPQGDRPARSSPARALYDFAFVSAHTLGAREPFPRPPVRTLCQAAERARKAVRAPDPD